VDDPKAFDACMDRVSREKRKFAGGMLLPDDPEVRKRIPIGTGVLDYFPLAIAYLAWISWKGNQQHNPGLPLHWARGKSADHADCIPRHLIDRGTLDADGTKHTGKLAWRALALLQEELEAERAAGLAIFPEDK
jgi:hypothetical protein